MGHDSLPPKEDIQMLVTREEDIEKIVNGEKTSVRRNDRYADEGELLELDGVTFKVEKVYPQRLGEVTEEDAQQEGHASLDAYKKSITAIHHAAVWDDNQKVWAHELKRAE